MGPNVPLIDNPKTVVTNMGVEMYPYLMGNCDLHAPVSFLESCPVFAISNITNDPKVYKVFF